MEDTTYLEDFFQSVELLPNDVRRDFELMREHDKEFLDGLRDLKESEANFLNKLKRKRQENSGNSNNSLTEGDSELVNEFEFITNTYNRVKHRSSQKSSLAINMLKDLEKFIRKLDSDLVFFETELRGCGEFEQLAKGLEPGSEVAVKVSSSSSTFEVILGRIIFFHSDIGVYDVADSDDSKRYQVSDKNVILLDLSTSVTKLSKGEEVLAVYPDTTSFYPAMVIQASKRNAHFTENSVTVQFHGDLNELGQIPSFLISLDHIVRIREDWVSVNRA